MPRILNTAGHLVKAGNGFKFYIGYVTQQIKLFQLAYLQLCNPKEAAAEPTDVDTDRSGRALWHRGKRFQPRTELIEQRHRQSSGDGDEMNHGRAPGRMVSFQK